MSYLEQLLRALSPQITYFDYSIRYLTVCFLVYTSQAVYTVKKSCVSKVPSISCVSGAILEVDRTVFSFPNELIVLEISPAEATG